VGGNGLSLGAAAREARRQGFRPLVLTSRLEGEAREAARVLVSILRECVATGRPAAPPLCLLAGGETTVTVRGGGYGGRNQEMAVAAVRALADFEVPALFASLATDGIDGRSDAAGGVVDRETLGRAGALGLAPPEAFLAESDSRSFLGPVGGLVVTGPTGTNVMDLSVLLADRGKAGRGRRGRRGLGGRDSPRGAV
jgi:hydroxypyruvate reductase